MEVKAFQQGKYLLNNWFSVWTVALVFGIIGGFLAYWLIGAFSHLFVRMAGGTKKLRCTANLLLYSSLPLILVSLLDGIYKTVVYGNKYFEGVTHAHYVMISMLISLLAILFMIFNFWKSVRIVQKTAPVRSFIFFIIFPILLYGTIFGFFIFAGVKQTEQPNFENEKALTLMEQGRYNEAISIYEKNIPKIPVLYTDVKVTMLSNLAIAYESTGQIEKAIETYEHAHNLSPLNSVEALLLQGNIFSLQNELKKSVDVLSKALQLNPNNFSAHNQLGLIFLGEYDPIFTDFAKALQHNQRAYDLSPNITTRQLLAVSHYHLSNLGVSPK